MLGDGQGDAGDVGFLKGVGADQLAAHLSGNANDGRRIQHRGGDAGDHVGRARSGGRDRNPNVAAGAGVAIRHMGGALLVAHQDVMDIAMFQRVIRRQNCASRITEDVLHAFALQAFPQNLCSRFCHGPCPQSCIFSATADYVGTAALGCPAERSSADFYTATKVELCSTGQPRAAVPTRLLLLTVSQFRRPVIIPPTDNLPARPRGQRGRRAPFLSRLPHQDEQADLPCSRAAIQVDAVLPALSGRVEVRLGTSRTSSSR